MHDKYSEKNKKLYSLGIGFASGILFAYIGVTVIAPEYGTMGIAWTALAVVLCILYGIKLTKYITKGEEIKPERELSESDMRYEKQKELYRLCRAYDKRKITKEEYESEKERLLCELQYK